MAKKRATKKRAKRKMKSAAQKLAAWVRSQTNKKLSSDVVQRVRWLYVHEKLTQQQIANKTRLSVKTIRRALHQENSQANQKCAKANKKRAHVKARRKPARKSNPKPRRIPKSSVWQKAKAVRFVRTRKGVRVDVRK